jgi:opacity protein-like surface antigen
MDWRFYALVPAALLAAGGTVSAQALPEGVYLGVRAIGSLVELDDVDTDGFAGATDVQNDSDTVAGLGGVVGYRWADIPLRTEIEAAYRFRFDFDVRDQATPAIDYEANVESMTVFFNALLEWRNESDFTPFIGGSIGWARHSSETTRVVVPTQASVSQDTDKDNLAWGAMAGVDWAFTEHWSAGLAYRYTNLGEVDAGSFSGGDSVSADDYTSHDVLLSFSYRF